MEKPNACIDCKYMKPSKTGQPMCMVVMDLCGFVRDVESKCGTKGKWFTPKEEK